MTKTLPNIAIENHECEVSRTEFSRTGGQREKLAGQNLAGQLDNVRLDGQQENVRGLPERIEQDIGTN